MVELRALGTAEIRTELTTITPSQEIVFAAALFILLEGRQKVSRTRLASILWPHATELVAAHRLRQTLFQLKKLGFAVNADRHAVRELQQAVRIDLNEVRSPSHGLIGKLPHLEVLPGYTPSFSSAFRDWVECRREEYHVLLSRLLVAEMGTARAKGDWDMCDRIAAQCLALDPLNESAVLAKAEATAMRGAKSRALELLDRYAADLGSADPNLRVPAAILRRRISEKVPEPSSIPVRDCHFIGRETEMQQLTTNLLRARDGTGGGLLITGEAGIGKSRLASELMQFAILEGLATVKTSCRRSDVDRPLSVIVDLVPQLTGMRGALGCSQGTLGTLRRLTDFDGRDCSPTALDEVVSSQAKVQAAVIDLIDAIVDEQPLLITIEDVQWLDGASTGILQKLLAWARNKTFLFVATQRIDASAPESSLSSDHLATISLGPLTPVHSEALLSELFGRHSEVVAPGIIEQLLALGEGNPFYIQELGSHWLSSGSQAGFPPSLTTLVNHRIDHLSPEAIQVLQACAVLGVNASIERVEAALEYKSHSLLSAIQELSIAGMLRTDANVEAGTSDMLTVRHDLLSTAAITRLAEAPLAFLHRRAGVVLERETLNGSGRTSVLWACAFHWRNAGDKERAFRAALSCADHLLDVGLPHDAAPAFEKALGYCVTDEQRLLVFSRLAIALQMNGQWDRSREALRISRQLQKNGAPEASVHDDLELALYEASWRVSLENAGLLDELRECTRSREAHVRHRVTCGLLGMKVAAGLSRVDILEELFVVMSPMLGDRSVPAALRFEAEMIYQCACGDISEGVKAAETLRGVLHDEKNHVIRSRALGNIGIALRLAGRSDEAKSIFNNVFEHARSHGLVSRMSFALLSLCRVNIAGGQIAQAREAFEKLEKLVDGDQDLHGRADRLYMHARLAFEEGKIETAWERHTALATTVSADQSANRRTAVLGLGIRIAMKRDVDPQTLQTMVEELEADHLRNRATGWQDFETLALVLGLRQIRRAEQARALLEDYVFIYRRERSAIPEELTQQLLELGGHYAVSATRRIEPLSGVL